MTYRSDHDAALARVDALEAENAQLQRKLSARTPTKAKPDRRRYWAAVGFIPVVGITAAVLAGPKPPAHEADLESCAQSLAAKPALDATETDPRGHARPVVAIARTLGCASTIEHVLDSAVISDEERLALERWRAAEGELSNEVSLIATYYAGDPYKLDNYASGVQLWREYDRAYDHRQLAIAEWRVAVRGR